MPAASPWTPALDEKLRELAARGDSYTKIAEHLGVSKNAVVGRAHRLKLPMREACIKRAGAAVLAAQQRRAAQRQAVSRDAQAIAARRVVPATSPLSVLPARPAAGVAVVPARLSPHRTCQWIAGEPAGARTMFCNAPTLRGSSYCQHHDARCWRPFEPKAVA